MHLWEATYWVPLVPNGDSLPNLAMVQGMIDHGWMWHNPTLGAPHGQQMFDFGVMDGDTLQLAIIRLIAFFTTQAAVAVNAYYVLGFGLIALSAHVVLRLLGIVPPVAVFVSVVFALVPYHFLQGQQHLFLATYFAVPWGCWLALRVLRGEPLFARRAAGGRLAWCGRDTVLTLVAVLVTGASNLYYAVFTLLLLAIAGLLRTVAAGRVRAVIPAAAAGAMVFAVLIANILPALVYQRVNGRGGVAVRVASESEVYAFSLLRLLMPGPENRIGPLAALGRRVAGPTAEASIPLGVGVAAVFVVVCVALLARAVRPRQTAGTPLWVASGLLALVVLLVGTVGGVSALIAYLASPQIRVWSRLSIVLTFLVLVAAAAYLSPRVRWDRRSPRGRAAVLGALSVVGALVVWEQVPAGAGLAGTYADRKAGFVTDANFVAALDARLPSQAMVLQLPLQEFPEVGPVVGMSDYQQLKQSLHGDLRWSYGAMKGRPENWVGPAQGLPTDALVKDAAAAGFQAVTVDRSGYADGGKEIEARLAAETGVTRPLVSADGRLSAWDLRALAQGLRRRETPAELARRARTLVQPPVARYEGEIYATETKGPDEWRWLGSDGTVEVENPYSSSMKAEVTARMVGYAPPYTMTIATPSGTRTVTIATKSATPLRVPLNLAPGQTAAVRFHVDGAQAQGDPRDLRVALYNLRVKERP